jgi:hypothetical protein
MSSCTFDFKTDIKVVWNFMSSHAAVLAMFFMLQWVSNLILNRSTRPSLNLLQRVVLTVITTVIVFLGNQMIGESDKHMDDLHHSFTPV